MYSTTGVIVIIETLIQVGPSSYSVLVERRVGRIVFPPIRRFTEARFCAFLWSSSLVSGRPTSYGKERRRRSHHRSITT